jgi:hypothetical protein
MVAGLPADEAEALDAARRHHHHAPLLERVARHPRLPESRSQCFQASQQGARCCHRSDAASHPQRAVGLARRIRQQRHREMLFVAERSSLFDAAVPDDEDLGAQSADALDEGFDAGDLLLAEQAAEVADEHEHGRSIGPEVSHADLAPVGIAQHERIEYVSGHGVHEAESTRPPSRTTSRG